MMFGLSPPQYDYILQTVVIPLGQHGAQVWCFGSRARGDHKPFSDLDLMVESPKDLTQEMNQIKEQLESGNFPYKVDLVQLSDFAATYLDNYQSEKQIFGS